MFQRFFFAFLMMLMLLLPGKNFILIQTFFSHLSKLVNGHRNLHLVYKILCGYLKDFSVPTQAQSLPSSDPGDQGGVNYITCRPLTNVRHSFLSSAKFTDS